VTGLQAAEELIKLVRQHSSIANFADGCGPDMITAAEQQLGLLFPPSYRRLVQEFGTWDIAGREFLGVFQTPQMGDVLLGSVRETMGAREMLDLPATMLQVQFDDESLIVVDTAELDSAGEGPVLAWVPHGGPTERLGDNFGEYALRACSVAVRNELRG